MRTIALANNKGGSGKTTTTVNLAAAFAELGLRVLVVDLDPQGAATAWLGSGETASGLVGFAGGSVGISELVEATDHGIDLIPTSRGLAPAGQRQRHDIGLAIVRAFAQLPDRWDLVMVDTPPMIGYLSLAPLVVADQVVIPVEAHALALPGVATVMASISSARRQVNADLRLLGIVACRMRATRHARAVVARMRTAFGAVVLEQTVREAIQIAEAPSLCMPITAYAPSSAVADDYRAVASELLGRMAIRDPSPFPVISSAPAAAPD